MAGFQPAITINEAMQRIRNDEYLLPAFQREYVWEGWQIEELFDSLMRGYPISSMLFWEVRDESKTAWRFYRFLKFYREKHNTHNELVDTKQHKDFKAVLDGQQRLTSLYIALFGHYDEGIRKTKWQSENDDRWFYISSLYFNLTQSKEPENPNVEYEFLWLDKKETKEQDIYIDKYEDRDKQKQEQKWFKCSAIYSIGDINDIINFSQKNNFTDDERKRLCDFHTLIFNTKDESKINFYLETEQKPDKAVNIFIRVNSNGEPLDYSDILFSIAIANWEKLDARTEINNLVDRINQDFSISKDLILKGFLYLFHNSVKFQINSFDKNFIKFIETKWESIRDCFVETFKLLKSFGLEAKTLSSNNAVLPILYFVYHKNLTNKIVDSVSQKNNREIIKRWLLRALILKPFGGSGDVVLANMRKAFIKDFKQNSEAYFDKNIDLFPLEAIEEEAKYHQIIDDEFLENEIIWRRKNSAEAFAILSFLYPNLDYKNNNFHKDHLHAENLYKEYKKNGEAKHKKDANYNYWAFEVYDSLPNLQMLDANENKSKQDKSLEQWVQENCKNDREGFLNKHLIPDIDLSLENFDNFYEARKVLLIKKLKEILN
ncbi:DUF262 domain-containing protein [Helicobacter fennelliae]|uniref:GmrSD restriction endonucleases N-terminal domain-containing protein n=1 Tax=Helicobacter fennelliae MRY12-0050 TaxID=1325130 RepID=T1DX28_9HELI|nr:DUF262 domain-containing protein [Helicobacter fennelliae]GAD20168.1 hypothetical protein HFN_1412 [Helicobacter fennelliae MRY12-0050]STP07592.1 Uncharacterized conserved protein [Helicobacter fennelliae]